MRERLTSSQPDTSIPQGFPKHPFRPERPGRASISLGVLLALVASVVAGAADATAARPGWSKLFTVDKPHAEDALLAAAFKQVAREGVNETIAAEVIGSLNRYIEGQLAERKQTTLCLGLIVDGLKAASAAQWSAEDAARFVVELQRQLDAEKRPALESLQELIARAREGTTVDQALGKVVGKAPSWRPHDPGRPVA